MKKRILSIILAAVMLVAALPFNVFALSYGTSDELANRTLGINMYNFSNYADNYNLIEKVATDGTVTYYNTNEDKLEEIEDVLAEGYINQIFVPVDANFEATVALCEKYGCDFWISAGYYNSANQTLENYLANVKLKVDRVRAVGAYDRMLGFYWDEPLWAHDMTNADLLAMTKGLYEKWGKRNYIVFATGSFIDGYDTEGEQLTKESSKYVTDAGWDNYSYDVRDSALNNSTQNAQFTETNTKYGTNIKTADEYYRWIHSEMMEKFDHDVYTWFFPAAYTTSTYVGGTADEDYCLAHLNFFKELLAEQKKPGGISLYSYASFSKQGLEQFLPINNIATSTQKLYPDVTKWTSYAARLKAIKTEFDSTKLAALGDMPFGSLDVADATHNTITINANDGYQYCINGGTYQTSGTFTGLKESTDYTVTVKRTSDGKTKDFAVSTTARYPYSTGLGDTASYAIKMPTHLNYYSPTYGWVGSGHSRNKDNTDYYRKDDGTIRSDGYIHLKTIEQERFLEVYNTNSDANSSIVLSFGDEGRATGYKGISKKIKTDNLTAFAIRMKTTGGTDDQLSSFDFYINSHRSTNVTDNPILFLDKQTLTVSTLTYSGGINITGNVDGWIIIPFDAWGDLDGDTTTTNHDWLVNNLTAIQIWQHAGSGCKHGGTASSWENKLWYVGDVMYVENVNTFVLARQGFAGIPKGTVGYVMDVPDTEQYVPGSISGVRNFGQWHSSGFLVSKSNANAADPFNPTNYAGSNGGLYVKNIDGESFMIFNPREDVYTPEYTDGTNTANTKYGTIADKNGSILFNNISSIKNPSVSGATGLALIDDYYESKITHIAFRLKISGGEKDQLSSFFFDGSGFVYRDSYFVDIETGEKIASVESSGDKSEFDLVGELDGYLVVPVTLAKLQSANQFKLFICNSGCKYSSANHGNSDSDWTGRVMCIGDIYAVSDDAAFAAQFVPDPVPAPDDTAKNILTVPAEGGQINYNQSKFYGLARWNTAEKLLKTTGGAHYPNPKLASDGRSFYYIPSVTDNGENFFDVEVSPAYKYSITNTATYYRATFLPGNYSTTADFNNYKDWAAISNIFADDASMNFADYNYVAIRLKKVGGNDGVVSQFKLNSSGAGGSSLKNVQLINNANGTTITYRDGITYVTLVKGFDGWLIVPKAVLKSDLGTLNAVGFELYDRSESSNWDDAHLYVGDMKIVKDLDAFKAAHIAPQAKIFSVGADITITNEKDTEKEALYSIDGNTWLNIDEFNELTFENNKNYTVFAKWPWSNAATVATRTVSTSVDGAIATILDVPDAGTRIGYSDYDYTEGMMYSSPNMLREEGDSGYTQSDGYAYLFSYNVDGETFFKIRYNTEGQSFPDKRTSCAHITFAPIAYTYGVANGTALGTVLPNDVDKVTHLAIRLKFEGVEGQNSKIAPLLRGTTASGGVQNVTMPAIKGGYIIDINTNEKTTFTSGSSFTIPTNFDGWLVLPEGAITGASQDFTQLKGVGFMLHLDDETTKASDNEGCQHWIQGSNWNNTTLYVGDMLALENDGKFVCDYLGIHNIELVEATAPAGESTGNFAHYACTICGKTYADADGKTEINPALLAFDAASLTLEQNIAINFKVNAANLAGLTNVYAKFTYMDGKTRIVKMGDAVNGKYIFTFDNIGPQSLGEEITAQLFGTYDGKEYYGEELTYSVKDYCYNKLEEHAESTDKDEFKTLLVDLLNYGAKAQTYTGTNTDALVNADLDYYEKKLATITPPTVNDGIRGIYDDLADENTLATWNGVNLYFETTVGMKFRFTAESTDGLTVKVMDAKTGGNVLDEIEDFTNGANGSLIAYFDKLDATQMRDTVYVAVYKDGVQVSDTLAYSALAYAGQKVIVTAASATDAQKNLASLVSHMIRYGDAAKAFVGAND